MMIKMINTGYDGACCYVQLWHGPEKNREVILMIAIIKILKVG